MVFFFFDLLPVARAFNPSSREVEADCCEFEASLVHRAISGQAGLHRKESSVLKKDFNLLNSFRQTLEALLFLGSQSQTHCFHLYF